MTIRVTWWLYWGAEPICSVLASPEAQPGEVRGLALDWHRRVPLCYPEAPYAFARKLSRAEVRR